jgi:hypothetical protein
VAIHSSTGHSSTGLAGAPGLVAAVISRAGTPRRTGATSRLALGLGRELVHLAPVLGAAHPRGGARPTTLGRRGGRLLQAGQA